MSQLLKGPVIAATPVFEPLLARATTGVTVCKTTPLHAVDMFRSPVETLVSGPLKPLMDDGATFLAFDATHESSFKTRLSTFSNNLPWKAYPGELYLSGDSLSLLLDATLDSTSPLYAKTQMVFLVLGSPSRKRVIVTEFLDALRLLHPDIVLQASASSISVWISGFPRRLKLCLVNEKYRSVADVLTNNKFPILQSAYDGSSIAMTAGAITAMVTRETKCAVNASLQYIYFALVRNYKVINRPFKFSDLMAANADVIKADQITYTGDVDALVAHTGIRRDDLWVFTFPPDGYSTFRALDFLTTSADWTGICLA